MSNKAPYVFEVHPSVIFKLGEELITDDYQALAELAKNCYDADAEEAQIAIFTSRQFNIDGGTITEQTGESRKDAHSIQLTGMIEIADDGMGMTIDDITTGWLTVSASKKRAMKHEGRKTPKGRTPLGDKGLGRLGVQRLGRVLEMETKAENGDAWRVVIDWANFATEQPLSQIPVSVQKLNKFPRPQGTTLRIYGLENEDQWDDHRKLQNRFIGIISPYSGGLGFDVNLKVDEKPVDLRERSTQLLKYAQLTYELEYRERILHVCGSIGTHYLANLAEERPRLEWERVIKPDGGRAFFDWLARNRKEELQRFSTRFLKSRNGFCGIKFDIELDKIDKINQGSDGRAFDPGNFNGRVDYFARRDNMQGGLTRSELREYLEASNGVRVYRNGFGIPVGNVVPFASQWTSGRSWYTLQPDNVVGYLNISTENNGQLIETTNREAFKDNVYYRNLQMLLSEWLNQIGQFQEIVRRGYKEYARSLSYVEADIPEQQSSREIAQSTRQRLEKARETIQDEDKTLAKAIEQSQVAVEILANRADDAEERFDDAWELAGLGLIAETVSHESSNQIGHIIDEAKFIRKRNDTLTQDRDVDSSALRIISLANALLKAISHLDSSLKYVRNRKDEFSIASLVNSAIEFALPRLERKGIAIKLTGQSFDVRMNQGRLLQALDNLITNSEYWLQEAQRRGTVTDPAISIRLDAPLITFSDNGVGIEKSVESTLFNPFVSNKQNGKGRGLGLYISDQMLDAEGCQITLRPDRNEFGNRYMFEIDLSDVEV